MFPASMAQAFNPSDRMRRSVSTTNQHQGWLEMECSAGMLQSGRMRRSGEIMNKIPEKISYVIPIAVTDNHSGLPVLVYDVADWESEVDLAFGVFFIGLKADRNYSVGVQISNIDEVVIPPNSEEFNNSRVFNVGASPDGEKVVSASIKVNFHKVTIRKPGIHRVDAVLLDVETGLELDRKHSFFDVKPRGISRDEFR